jgi:hypothetical protein
VIKASGSGDETVRGLRQWPTLEALAEYVGQVQLFLGALLIGSFARGTADDMSDLDLILVSRDEGFEDIWQHRQDLHVTGALAAWDERFQKRCGAHKWLTRDCVFVECLIAAPSSGVKLAAPFVVVTGEPNLPTRLEQRSPILRAEMGQAQHPVERAYDELKRTVRTSPTS